MLASGASLRRDAGEGHCPLSQELARQSDYEDDGSAHFKPEDALVPGALVPKDVAVACGAFRRLSAG